MAKKRPLQEGSAAKSILEGGKEPLSWKPKKGLIKLSSQRKKQFEELSKIPGNTPLKELPLFPGNNKFFVKMEFENKPTGSHYDRVYPYLLECLEKIGITPSRFVLIENSSGNATPAFGWFAGKLGYETIAFLPAELSKTRQKLTQENCGKVVIADEEKHGWGVYGAANAMIEAINKNREERKINPSAKRLYCVNHSQVMESLDAIESMAGGIVEQLGGKKLDYFLGVAGNGTILYGVGKALRKHFPHLKIIAVESYERPVLYLMKFPGKYEAESGRKPISIQEMKGKDFFAPGTGALGIDFPHLHSAISLVDEIIMVKRNEAEAAIEELQKNGYSVGHTSAMSYVAAKKLSEKIKGKSLLAIFYDDLNRY